MPTALVITTARWLPTARLGIALKQAGFEVDFLCPDRHPILKTKVVRHRYLYQALVPLPSLKNAVRTGKPDLIIPGDDLATHHLHDLYDQGQKQGESDRWICELIENSLGSASGFQATRSRASFIALAQEEGIRVPVAAMIPNREALRKWIEERGLPVVLKTDGSSSGEGVRVATTPKEAERAFQILQLPLGFVRVAKRALINGDLRWIRPTLERRPKMISGQEFIDARDATSLVACWRGEVLAGLHFEVLVKQYLRGPASVLHLIDNVEMISAIQKIARRLNLSGLHGFDFLLEGGAGTPYLIEMNPRATQVGHLSLGKGRDLPAALYSGLTRKAVQESPKVTDNLTIALFPQEWIRNPESPYLRSGYHDIPWEEPELMRECLRKTRTWKDWRSLDKLIRHLSANRQTLI